MSLSSQEFERLQGLIKERQNPDLSGFSSGGYSFKETGQDIMQIGSDLKSSFLKRTENVQAGKTAMQEGKQGGLETLYQTGGQAAGLLSDVFGDVFKGAVKTALPQSAETGIKTGISSAMKPIVDTEMVKGIIQKYQSLGEEEKRNIDASLGFGSLIGDVVGLGAGKKAVDLGVKTAIEGATKVGEKIITPVVRSTSKLIETTIPKIKPVPTAKEAVGQILQGETGSIDTGLKALASVDTKGVKTFKELNDSFSKKVGELSRTVDEDLGQDTTKTLLKDLSTKTKNVAGKEISQNPVENSLNQLKELYQKTGDKVMESNVDDLLNTAKTQGLTKQEVNDIARVYGSEFGSKAFGKTGEALTSVNAQMYENTRKAIKDVARSGINGEKAKLADQTMSSILNTQTLIKKNIEAVNKLQQRIQEMGLLGKFGHAVTKYADLLTGGTIRGVIGGLLPRGAGYKVMNALDLEEVLGRNLNIINNAIKSGKEADIQKILNNSLKR